MQAHDAFKWAQYMDALNNQAMEVSLSRPLAGFLVSCGASNFLARIGIIMEPYFGILQNVESRNFLMSTND